MPEIHSEPDPVVADCEKAPVFSVAGVSYTFTIAPDGLVILMKTWSGPVCAGLTVPEMTYAPESVAPAVGLVKVTMPAALAVNGATVSSTARVSAKIVGSDFNVPPV